MEIEYVGIDTIKPYENNAKLHPAEQIEQIKRSIQDYGMNDPIAVWHDEIVEGHGRLMACKELGIDIVPIIRLDDLTDDQRKEYMLVHNKTTMNSDFDTDLLDIEIGDLPEFDAGFYEFGINDISPDGFGEDFTLPDGDKSDMCQITFYLHERQKELIEYAMSVVGDDIQETFGNKNKHGNQIYEVVRQWAELKK